MVIKVSVQYNGAGLLPDIILLVLCDCIIGNPFYNIKSVIPYSQF